jgi:glycosyltransferase involved in cell wall biosynthesis
VPAHAYSGGRQAALAHGQQRPYERGVFHCCPNRSPIGAKKLRVLHVIPAIAPRFGGPSHVIVSMVEALNRRGDVRAEIATTDAGGGNGEFEAHKLAADLPVHWFRQTWSERWKFSADLRRWLRSHASDYDLVNIHAVWSFATMAAARAAARRDVPYLVRPAGMLSEYTWNHHRWHKQLYWQLIEHRTIQEAAAFHVTSEEEAAEVRRLRADARVFVISNGVDSRAFSAPHDKSALRRRCGLAAADKPIVLFLSRLHPKKGIVDCLLPAMANLRVPCFLAIAGADDPHAPGHSREVVAAVDKFALRDRVALLGEVAGDARWPLFDGADLFVLPSHSENFGVVVAEAMARGCPVVVSDAVQSNTHVTAAGAGEVVPGDVAALAGAIDRMLGNVSVRKACGEAGRAYAQRNFCWTQIAAQIHQMYEECLALSLMRSN